MEMLVFLFFLNEYSVGPRRQGNLIFMFPMAKSSGNFSEGKTKI